MKQGTVKKQGCRHRLVYKKNQVATLQAWFQKDPYPDTAARERLAEEIGVLEKNVWIWFKNCRQMQRRLGFGYSLGKHRNQEWSKSQPCTADLPKDSRGPWTPTMGSQTSTPGQSFERNQIPDFATKEELATPTGTLQPRIQEPFLNRRDQHLEHRKRESINPFGDSPKGNPDLTLQQHQIELSTHPGRSHFLPPNSFCRNQTFSIAPPATHVSFVPWHPGGGSGSLEPCILMVPPTQAVQGGENSDTPLTPMNPLTKPPTLLRSISDTQTPVWSQCQGKCQDHSEHTGREVLQLKDSYPEPENVQVPDVSYVMRWWDEGRLALIEEWEPPKGTLAGHTGAASWASRLRSHVIRLTNATEIGRPLKALG
ncbi:double homeobox protein B-like [Choloepus didactylus]|uniref:double homeobox protein B-like n=1 Tax=Choloepus didactylus TaxID=27675 RepID=UPI00189D69FA|nr:double homeobox protein B-like [Choloepus didactylus]XP_037672058.1 double homeobox protein B-like [Choloepus didactylus]